MHETSDDLAVDLHKKFSAWVLEKDFIDASDDTWEKNYRRGPYYVGILHNWLF